MILHELNKKFAENFIRFSLITKKIVLSNFYYWWGKRINVEKNPAFQFFSCFIFLGLGLSSGINGGTQFENKSMLIE